MIAAVIVYAYVLALLLIAPMFERYGKEVSRKFVHIMTCNWWFIIMAWGTGLFWSLVVSVGFLVVNVVTYKYSLFKSIERESKEKSKGTIYYAITMNVLVIVSFYYQNIYAGLIGCLVMGYADGLSAIIGKKLNYYPYKINNSQKSLSGNLTMLVVTWMIVVGVSYAQYGVMRYDIALMMALIATLLETVSPKGTDNLTVPISMALVYILSF